MLSFAAVTAGCAWVISTFSWLGIRHHGKGIGTHMRAA
jgi:hypothetical protein